MSDEEYKTLDEFWAKFEEEELEKRKREFEEEFEKRESEE